MDLHAVTPRELAVLDLLGEQLTHDEIGRTLFISVRTVESHAASLRRKLAMADHRALVRFAVTRRQALPVAGALLPVALTPFVGRAVEQAEMLSALRTARLLSVVGPGGAGKTRLAVATAAAAADDFADGVRFVDLVPVTDPARVDAAVAEACGASPSSRLSALDAAIAELRPRNLLLLIDNCDQHTDSVAVLTEKFLRSCPALTVLVTSRARLAVPHERVYRVAGLSPGADGDAVALFVDRATAAGSPPPTADELDRISTICRALDGLALAVELTATRLPSLGLAGIEHGLRDQADLLRGGARADVRQRSMHETLDWSVALLDVPAAAVLRRLAVLVAPFDEQTAAAVAAFEPVKDELLATLLGRLSDHSLLTASTESGGRLRYRMLEPIRQFGLARMTVADAPARNRHLRWCLRTIEASTGATAVEAVADDARAALGWALAEDRPDPAAAALARSLGLLLFRVGRLGEAQQRLTQAAKLATEKRYVAADLGAAAAVAKCRVRGEEALTLELAAAAAARDAGQVTEAAMALVRSAELLTRYAGMFADPDPAAADSWLEEARALAPRDRMVSVAAEVTEANRQSFAGRPGIGSAARDALHRARETGHGRLISAALDAATREQLEAGGVVAAYRFASERVARLLSRSDDPAAGLEIKDALHTAIFCALGAGDLSAAREMARRQRDLEFLSEERDLADEELLAPAALAGDWSTVIDRAAGFLRDWTAAGRPAAPGRGLGPAAVALAHGLRGETQARAHWLGVLAHIRGVPVELASTATGYGELFDALVLLHNDRPQAALDILTAKPPPGMFVQVFRQWTAAFAAEAAVLAGDPDADRILRSAVVDCEANPVAVAVVRRAGALRDGDQRALQNIATDFEQLDMPYQQVRTFRLAALA